MLVSGGLGIRRIEVTYGVSRFARAGRFCCVRCCLFQAASVQLFRFFRLSVVLAVMTARQTNNSLAAALSSLSAPSAPVSSTNTSGTSSIVSSQSSESVVVSSPLVSVPASANPLPTASTAVLSPDLVSLINQAVQSAVQASQRQPGPAIADPVSCPGASSSSASLGGLASTFFAAGTGFPPSLSSSSTSAHIVGKYNGKVFEDREVSFLMREGSEEGLLPGVEEAILKMCSGEKAQIFIFPGKWGFGKSGKPEFGIPENASLEYVIHLKKFENSKENWELSNDEKISSAETTKEKGTKYFKKGKYKVASQQYARVVRLLDGYFSNEEKEKRDPLLIAGHLNLAACHLKLNNNFKCIKECDKALQMDKKSVKALFRRGKARIAVDELDLAKEDFQQALELDPGNKEAQQQLQLVNKKIRLHTAKEKSIYANMFERLARQEEQETGHEERKDVFQEAVDKETEAQTNSLSMNDQVASSTEVNGEADEEMKEDDKGGIVC